MLLVENVLLSVLPIGERLHVARLRQNRLAVVRIFAVHLLLGLDLERFEGLSIGRRELHRMRVDNFGFLLKVERFTIFQHYSAPELILKVLLIARAERFGIRVSHELVSHASPSSASVAADSLVVHHESVLRLSH